MACRRGFDTRHRRTAVQQSLRVTAHSSECRRRRVVAAGDDVGRVTCGNGAASVVANHRPTPERRDERTYERTTAPKLVTCGQSQ